MPASKISMNHDTGNFYCSQCERHFRSAGGVLSHARTAEVHANAWCEQCKRLFASPRALNDHLANASNHNTLTPSDEGYLTEVESDASSYPSLTRLAVAAPSYPYQSDYYHHPPPQAITAPHYPYQRDHYHYPPPQATAPPHYQYQRQAEPHQYRHYQPHTIECYGCYEQFGTRSGMLMHLESGACESRVELHDIDEWAFRGSDSREYTNSWRSYYKYRCPTCDTHFRVVSALIQHIEERDCGQRIRGSVKRMVDYIERKVLA